MDRVTKNHAAVRQLVEEFATEMQPNDGTRLEVVTDEAHGHYQVLRIGWKDRKFYHDCLMHFAIRTDGKIHLLENRTESEVDYELMRAGVAFEDIVVAFNEPALQATA